jgi:cytochrome b
MGCAPDGRAPWDFPTRAFHWSLAALVVFSFVTGKLGGPWMDWHMRSGCCILALLLFRLAWGFAGPPPARFAHFLKGPASAREYVRGLRSGMRENAAGHNPLGGWMVAAMLAALLAQAGTGLFSNDEASHQGPLADLVGNATVDRLSVWHSWNQWLVVALVCIHVLAIAVYQWMLRIDLVRAMWRGGMRAREGAIAAALLAAASIGVYWLVTIFPRP